MFRATNKHQAVDDAGVTVTDIDQNHIEYRWGDRVLVLGREGAVSPSGGPAQIIYLSAQDRWNPPYRDEPLPPAVVEKIGADLIEACKVLDIYTFIRPR